MPLVLSTLWIACERNHLPEVKARPGEWTVGSRPVIDLGEEQRSALSTWLGFRQTARRSDGSIVIADEQSHRIRVHDANGRKLFEFGGTGSAPGKFESLVWVGVLPGDSIYAYDMNRTLFMKFTPTGQFVRAIQPPRTGMFAFARPVGLSPSRRLYVLTRHPEVQRRGFYTDSSLLVLLDRDRLKSVLLGSFPVYQQFTVPAETGWYSAGVPHSPVGRFAIYGSGFLFGWGDEPVLRRYSEAGQLIATWRLPIDPQRIEPRALRAARRSVRKANPERARDAKRAAREMPLPRRYPYFNAIVVTDDRHVWVRPVRSAREASIAWLVLDSTGTVTGRVRLPAQFYPSNVRDSTVLGRYYDQLGEQHLGLYRLRPPARRD